MKKPDWKLGKVFTLVTTVYLVCSLFGCLLYMVLPPVLSSIGARIHVYLLLIAALDTSESIWPMVLTVIAHLYVLVQAVFGFTAIKTGNLKPFTLLTMLEILFTLILLVVQDVLGNEFSSGILLNAAYCAWLLRKIAPKKIPAKK